MGKTLVILGAGIAGLPIAHHALKHTVHQVKDLKVILVTPNTDHFWNLASVRAIVPGQFPDSTLFSPIEPEFAQYPKQSWEIVNGKAESLDPDTNQVTVVTNGGARRTIPYDGLVIATGTRYKNSMPWKEVGTTEETKQRLHTLQDQIKSAKSIMVVGGGTTGSEALGEIAFEYGKKGKKIYWVINKSLPLDEVWREDIRKGIKKEVQNLGVEVIHDTRVTSARADAKGGYEVELTDADGKTKTVSVDAYLPTTGTEPNSAFVPAKLRDDAGFVLQDETLRAPGYKNLFVVGDVGSLEVSTAQKADLQLVHAAKNLQKWFTGGSLDKYTPDTKLLAAVTLGRSRGTGQAGTWKLPSLVVWYLKGRYLGTNYSKDVAAGQRTMLVKSW